MQHCRWGLTREQQRGRIPSLPLLATFLWMQPRTHLSFWAASSQCQGTSSPSSSSTLLSRAALHLSIPQPVWEPGIAPTQVQHLALGLVEPHEFHVGPLPEFVQAPWMAACPLGVSSAQPQVGVIRKLAGSAIDPTVNVLDEEIKLY